MLTVLTLLTLSFEYSFERENNIENSCEFDILRIKKKDTMCSDYGIYVKYCNHYSQPEEFVIYNENSINGKQIIIKPYGMWKETSNDKKKIADFYYTFTCDYRDNYPKLIQHIIPVPGEDINPLIYLVVIVILIIAVLIICPNFNKNYNKSYNSSYNFWTGYTLGSKSNNRKRHRMYCE